MKNLSNVSLREFRSALIALGLTCDGINGGHEKWSKQGMHRPVVFQTHLEPVPEFIIKNAMRDLVLTRKQFIDLLESL